jgi:hypothetical protein
MKGDKMKENEENIEAEKCWICKRGFAEAIEEFNKKVLSNEYIDKSVKSKYEKGKKEFFPYSADQYIDFLLANVKGGSYALDEKVVGNTFIMLCPVCSGLLESLSPKIDVEDFVTKKDLEDVSIFLRE